MALHRKTLIDCGPDLAVAAFNAGFSGYAVPVAMTVPQFETRFRAENLDPFASHVWLDGDQPAAILLIARRGWVSRMAALGVAPAHRGAGLGRTATALALDEARARGDRALVLEVIASNTAAVALYRRMGFAGEARLYGFACTGVGAGHLDQIDPAEAARIAGGFAARDLPWQLQPATIGARGQGALCLTDAARSIVAVVEGAVPRLTALALAPDLAPGAAAAFTRALLARFGPAGLVAPALFPDDHRARFFLPGGWEQGEMQQLMLRADLTL